MKGTIKMEMPVGKAEEKYKEYLEAVKTRKEKYLEDLKKVYFNLKQGKTVIDLFECMKKAGVNEFGEPRLAVSIAGKDTVKFRKLDQGSGTFHNGEWPGYKIDVQLPSNIFPDWKRAEGTGWQPILRDRLKTGVPIVPAHLLPNGNLDQYYILWEVQDWDEDVPARKDPFLLRRISLNLFAVFSEWEVTRLEQSVVRGRQ